MNSAVRDCAANPLLHMARSLRANAHTAVASPPPPLQCTDLNAPSSPPPPATPPPADQSSRASCLTSSNGARLEPLVVGSESQLRELLSEVGVDTTEWLRLTTADLLAELRAGESTLCRTEDGGLTRVVSYCEVELLLRGRVLVLTHEESDGHARQQFVLPRAKMRAGEIMWQAAAHRAIHAALELPADTVALHMETHASESGMGLHASCPGRAYPALPAEVVRHFCHATLHPHTGEGAISGGISAERFCLPVGGAVGGEPHRRLHWGWYPLREWETVKRKKDLEARARNEEASRLAVGIAAGDEPRAKVRVRYDGLGELVIRDDELGPAQTQLEVVAQLYAGCSTVWYHIIAGGFSRAKILHVQAVDGRGQWQDPTICKLSPIELLRAEADAHAVFARYIGESVPQRIGEPVYVDEIGGMVLELVGACWRVPELAHTQAMLSNTFEQTCRYDSDHAGLEPLPSPAPSPSGLGSPAAPDGAKNGGFGLIDEPAAALETNGGADAAAPASNPVLVHHIDLPAFSPDRVGAGAATDDTVVDVSDDASEGLPFSARPGISGAPIAFSGRVRDRPVFGEVRIVIDEVILGQLNTVLMQSAHREPGMGRPFPHIGGALFGLAEHYNLLQKRASQPQPRSPRHSRGDRVSSEEVDSTSYEGRGYDGPWFGIIHGDLHGGNIMVDSRSYAWLIDYGEVDDGHVFRDPAKLEACMCFIYTTMPIPPEALLGAPANEVRCWLSCPMEAAECIVTEAGRRDAVGELSFDTCREMLQTACSHAGDAGQRVDVDEMMLRFAPKAECDEYLAQGCRMVELLAPFRDLNMPIPCTFIPSFLTKERLRLCWEQVLQIRGLLPASSCRPHKGTSDHPYDSHPMQYACALLHFTLKMATQYREPNPYARKLASHSLGHLAGYLARWLRGQEVEPSPAVARLASQHTVQALAHRLEYDCGQRLCFVDEGIWREGMVLAPPAPDAAAHTVRVFSGTECTERQVDLALHSHTVIPLYAYDAGHPLEILESRGHWKECVVVNRTPACNQYVVRVGPTGSQLWVLLLPWNHRTLSTHQFVPLFAVHSFVKSKWGDDAILEGVGVGAERADELEKPQEEDFDEASTIQVDHGKLVEFVLNIRSAQRGRALSLWCPGQVVAIHKRQFGTAIVRKGLGLIGKTCDVVAGAYRFTESWQNDDVPLLVRLRVEPPPEEPSADAQAVAAASQEGGAGPSSAGPFTPEGPGSAAGSVGGIPSGFVTSPLFLASPPPATVGGISLGDGSEPGSPIRPSRPTPGSPLPTPDVNGVDGGGAADGKDGTLGGDAEPAVAAAPVWGAWVQASVEGPLLRLDDGEGTTLPWEHCMEIECDVLPIFCYPPSAQLRVLRAGVWSRFVVRERAQSVNTYEGVVDGVEPCSIVLTRANHAPALDASLDIDAEHLKYAGWVRSTFSFVVDALSGERLDIMQQCVKLRIDGALPGEAARDPFEVVLEAVSGESQSKPVLVTGEAASGKSTFARRFMVLCLQQRSELQLVPFLLTTIDLMRIIKQNSLGGDYLDGYLRCVYGPRSRRYLYLKQAMLERRLVLFLDGMDEVPTGLKSVVEAYIMTTTRMSARVVMTSRPGGFSKAWIDLCITMKILPLDAEQQEVVAQARLVAPAHLRMCRQLLSRPDLQQLASNPLILSMVISYIRGSGGGSGSMPPLNRWKLYHTAMSTIITRLDAKTLEARKGQAGRDSGEYMLMLQEIAFKAHCKQMKDLNSEVLRAAITEQTSALWDDVKESVARGQFAVLTAFVENDETIYRFGHLTFQEHLCSMVINRMLGEEMDRVKNIMTATGGIRKMLQGSWWLTVVQFCLEGLMAEGERGEELANRFAETMLEEAIHKEGVLKLSAKELHSFDSMSAFAVMLRHTYKATALELGDGKADLNAEWLPQLCSALSGHPTLRRLTLRRMMINGVSAWSADVGLQALSAVLRSSTVLEVLQLQSCGLESRHVLPLCSELRASPIRLRELDLSGNKIADGGLVALAHIFEVEGVTLEMLDISGNALEEGGVAAIAKALSASSGLRTVKLANHALPIQELKTGAAVDMDGQKLTDFDLQFMAEVISSAPGEGGEVPTIPAISLGYNGLTDKGACMLARALSGGLKVRRLNLRGNKVGVDGAVALVAAMHHSRCPLELLDLSDNGICGLNADGSGRYSPDAVHAICSWLRSADNPLRELKIGQNQLCGVNWEGRGHYTSVAVEALCEALSEPSCCLTKLMIFGNCWGNRDTLKLADALKTRSAPLEVLDMRWNEMGSAETDALLDAATASCTVEHMPQRLRCGATLNAHTNWVETLQHDNEYMYSGSQDMTIRKWRRSDLHCEAVLKGHEKGVLSLKLLGDMLYAGDRKGEIKLWKVGPGPDQHTCKGTLSGHKGAIWMLQYDEEIGRLYSCCDDKKVISWDVAQLKQVKAFDGHKDKVYREALFLEGRESPEGGVLFAGDSTGTVYQWDIGRRTLSHSWKAHEGSVWGMLMSTFALITGGLDGMVKLWDPRTRDLVRRLYRHNQSVCSFSVQANVFYSCAVDNIIKVWDWKDGTCLGTMHGHRETVANLCLTPEGTLFSSGIDKMVKVWKPPGSWGEEWHGLRELDLTTAGMVAEDVDRLEKQLSGKDAAKRPPAWVLLSVSNNCLYDEGIGKLVKVLQKTTAPLETLDLSKTGMTSNGAKLVAELLAAPEGTNLLPLKKLVLHGNAIGTDGYAAIGAAIRHPRCALVEFVVSTQMREKKTGQNRVSKSEEHNCVLVADVKSMAELRTDFIADPEMMIMAEVLLLNTALHTIELKKNKLGDDGVNALARAVATSTLPIKVLHLEGNLISAEGATELARGLREGRCPLVELTLADNSITLCGAAVRRRRDDQEREAELKKLAGGSRTTPGSEWAKAQLQVRTTIAEWRQQRAPLTNLTHADFKSVLQLPKELREDRWEEIGGLYGIRRGSGETRPGEQSASSSGGASAASASATASSAPAMTTASTPAIGVVGRGATGVATAASSAEPLPPTPKQLGKLTEEQLQQLWDLVTTEPPDDEGLSLQSVDAICSLLEAPGSKLSYLDLSSTALCGVDGGGKPLLGCEYTSESVGRLCTALRSEHCRLTTLKLTRCQMRNDEAVSLAAAVKACSLVGPMVQTLVLEGSALPVPQLLGIRELSQGLHKRLSTECSKLHASEITLLAELLAANSYLETLDFNSSSIGAGLSRISAAIRQQSMPLVTLHIAENSISVTLAVELVGALRIGAHHTLTDLDLSGNPLFGVEEGGRDEYTTDFIESLCAWMQDGARLQVLQLVDVALCGLARDGNGSYQSQGISVLNEMLASSSVVLRSLNVSGCKVREDDAHLLGKGLVRNRALERLVLDKTALMVQQLARGERLSLNAVDFSEVDATLMGQLLLQNLALGCIDLGGSKPLVREIKVLSDAFVRCRFSLRELSVSGRLLGLEGSASLLDALKECPLEVLDLTGNEICGVKPAGTEPFNTFVLKMACALVRRPERGLRRLKLKGNNLIGNDVYTNEAVVLIADALRSEHCRLEELQLGLINKSDGLRDEDGLILGTAVQACTTLLRLSVTRAALPMAELLDGSTSLDLEGKGLGRTEMGIAAQILRSNGTLRTLKLTDNCMGRHGLLALADAIGHAKPPLEEVLMGNVGIASGDELHTFLRALRDGGAPLRVLDVHSNPLCIAEHASPPPSDGASASSTKATLKALVELCDWLSSPGNTISVLNLREVMPPVDATLPTDVHDEAVRLLCDALGSPHCVLRELNVHGFGFKPPSSRPSEANSPPSPKSTKAAEAIAAASSVGASRPSSSTSTSGATVVDEPVRTLDLSAIGTNMGNAGLAALAHVAAAGGLPHLTHVTLRDTSFKKAQLEVILKALLDGACPLEELELSGTALCLSAPGRFCIDALRLVCALVSRPGSRLRKLGLRGTHLCGLPPGCDSGERYTLEGITLVCEALASPDSVLAELDVSDNGMKAEREAQPPSRLPARLYAIGKTDGQQLSQLSSAVRSRLLRFLEYPACFRAASARGFDLPPVDAVAAMETARFLEFWGQANEADRSTDPPLDAAAASDAAMARVVPQQRTTGAVTYEELLRASGWRDAEGNAGARANESSAGVRRPTYEELLARAAQNEELARQAGIGGASSAQGGGDAGSSSSGSVAGASSSRPRSSSEAAGGTPSTFPEFDERHTSLMAKYLSREMYDSLHEVRTGLAAFTLDQIIAPGLRRPETPIGLAAADVDSYDRFSALFDRAIEHWHAWVQTRPGKLDAHKSDLDASKLEPSADGDGATPEGVTPGALPPPAGVAAISRVAVSRNLAEHAFMPAMGVEDFSEVERVLLLALRSAQPGELGGVYTPLAQLDDEAIAALRSEGLYVDPTDPPHFATRDGHTHQRATSGVWRAAGGELAAWINMSDHLQIVGVQRGGGARRAFEAVHTALSQVEKVLLEQGKTFALHRRLGYVGTSPAIVGTAQLVAFRVRLPGLTALGAQAVEEVAAEYGLRATPLGGTSTVQSGSVYGGREELGGSAASGGTGESLGREPGRSIAAAAAAAAASSSASSASRRRSRGRLTSRDRRTSREDPESTARLASEGRTSNDGSPFITLSAATAGYGGRAADAVKATVAMEAAEWWEVANRGCIGRTEVQIVQLLVDGVAALGSIEERLAGGENLKDAMTPPPPPESASIQLARAVRGANRAGAHLQQLTLSSTPLPVLDWAGEASTLSLAGLRLYDRDAVLLAELLALNSALVSLDLSQCRMTEAGTLAIARALATARPSKLTKLRVADNRLRVSGAHALLDALEFAKCELVCLDLSANELCGGTVAEDHSFGLIKGSAARLSEHGQLCRLDSDGLCSAGPRMEPNSGCYRIEFEVLQATDGDGAYVGVIRPDANKSSYPGSDDKGVGWRAKGGVRHLHNTVEMGGAIAGWGQGDRVGLMLDTHTCELTFYKNGKVFEQRYTVTMDGGMYFAVGRYYGSYVVRCLYVHQQGGNEEMDYSALERLCMLLHEPTNTLRELRIANNQLTGVSKFHGGKRNDRGLQRLLEAFNSTACRLTHLDVSGNGLSSEDASKIVAVALQPGSSVQLLKVHLWLVPVRQLAGNASLDLRGQAVADEDAVLLARLLESRAQLTRLDLNDNKLGASGVTAIADAIVRSATPLRWLSVASNRLGAPACTALLRGLAEMAPPGLHSLDLSDNPITDGPSGSFDTRALAALDAILTAPSCALTSLGLAATQLCGRDADACYIGEGVALLASSLTKSVAPLAHVRLSGNSMRDPEAELLAATLVARAAAERAPLSFDLSTNSLSATKLHELAELCTLTAAFQKPVCERTFVGFDKCVYGAATDSECIFLAHGSGPIVKISLSEWKELGRFEGHSDDTNCIVLHDGLLLSGSDDYTVKAWSTTLTPSGEGQCVATLAGHEARVWSVVTTEEHIYSCSADKSIIAWSMADARRGVSTQVARLTAHTDVVYAVRIALGALFSSSADKTIKRYDLHTHRTTLSWEAHAHSITCLAASEQLQLLASGAEDGRISLWSLAADVATSAGSLYVRPSGPRSPSSNSAVYALAVSPISGDVLFSGGADYRVHMFDLRKRTLLHTLTGHASTVRALCFTSSGDKLCSSGGDFNLLMWRVPAGAEPASEGTAEGSSSRGGDDEPKPQLVEVEREDHA